MTDRISHLNFTKEQYEIIEKLAASNYSAKDIAIYLNVDPDTFSMALSDHDSLLYKAYYRGALIIRAGIDINLSNVAAAGKITAIQIQMKRKEELDFQNAKREMFGI